MKISLNCYYCGKEIARYPCQIKAHNFCSRQCLANFSSREKNPKGYAELKDYSNMAAHMTALNKSRTGVPLSNETKQRMSNSRHGTGEGKSYLRRNGRHVHRIVAEIVMGAKLDSGTVIHHIDGNKRNNSPNNLMVFQSQAEHARFEMQQKKMHRKEGGDGE